MKVMLSGCPHHHSMACPQAAAGEGETCLSDTFWLSLLAGEPQCHWKATK